MANGYKVIDEKTWDRAMHCMVFRNSIEQIVTYNFESEEDVYERIFRKG